MDVQYVISVCVFIVSKYEKKSSLQEFELLAYEQSCRTLETILKEYRETWENKNEFGNFTR